MGATVLLRRDQLVPRVIRCECNKTPCLEPHTNPIPAVTRGGKAALWSICPLGELHNPMLQAGLQLTQLAQVSPLLGWPDDYSGGVVEAVLAIRQAQALEQERTARERERRTANASRTRAPSRGRRR